MVFIFYTIVVLLVALLPPVINSSPTLQLYMRACGAAGAILGYFIGGFVATTLTKKWQIIVVILSVLLMIGAAFLVLALMLVIEPYFVKQFPSWKPYRDTLLRIPLLLNFLTGIGSGVLLLSLVGLVTALKPPQPVNIPSFSELDSNVRWTVIAAAAALAIAIVVVLIVAIPIWWVQLGLLVFGVAFLYLFYLNPDFLYRRTAVWLILSWSTLNFSIIFAAKDTPWGDYLLSVGNRMDESFNYAVPIVAAVLLFFDIVNRIMSRRKGQG